MNEKYSFDEYKIMYESTEKVTDRRISNNKLNYTISVAILVSIGIIGKWSIQNEKYFFFGLVIIILLAGLAIPFCFLWIGQIEDFKKLNTAKFNIIDEMANKIYFESSDSETDVKSFKPFSKEWEKLKEIDALQNVQQNNIVALKSSNAEYFIPKAFKVIFIIIGCISIIALLFNIPKTLEEIKLILHI